MNEEFLPPDTAENVLVDLLFNIETDDVGQMVQGCLTAAERTGKESPCVAGKNETGGGGVSATATLKSFGFLPETPPPPSIRVALTEMKLVSI